MRATLRDKGEIVSYSATRLTCYALLSSLEEDLRSEIEAYIPLDNVVGVLGPDRAERVQARRSRDHGPKPAASLAPLIPYLDFADSYEVLLSRKSLLPLELANQLASLADDLGRLTPIRNRVAHTRPMEVDDLPSVIEVARQLTKPHADHWVSTRVTLERLSEDPAYVLGLTINLPTDSDSTPPNNLPTPDFDETGFFGRRQQINRIMKAIKGAYPVVSILGDGGVGKTSIALKVAYELLEDPTQPFDTIVWVSAKATILTTNEIQRIGDAIQDSLGLFVAAAAELGSITAEADPVGEVLSYLEAFKVLLILDNLETVLDDRLRQFLLDLPMGSKVIITSRIGLGIENPVQLEPLSEDEARNLLRALARTRHVKTLEGLDQETVTALAKSMGGHPAYIKWFVSGVQAGRRPEELLVDNELLLDFCMSNVYQYLDADAQAVLRSMQALPGARNQAELAYLNDYTANKIQKALLDLITTNFVQMQNRSPAALQLETTYQLTDFGKQYLDKQHPVAGDERAWLLDRNAELFQLGASLKAESSASPFDPGTVDVRGAGDFHVAKLLRDAIRAARRGEVDAALENCREGQVLSPTFYEAWRVEAFVQDARSDHTAANAAFERALELAPESQQLNYFYGTFLADRYGDPVNGLRYLQAAARSSTPPPAVVTQIAWTHLGLKDWPSVLDSATHAISLRPLYHHEASAALIAGLRATVYGARAHQENASPDHALELIESAVSMVEVAPMELIEGEVADRIIQIRDFAEEIANSTPDDYIARSARLLGTKLGEKLRIADVHLLERRVAIVKTLVTDKYFGFARLGRRDYFFHLRDLPTEAEWDYLFAGAKLAITPNDSHPRGPRAEQPRYLD